MNEILDLSDFDQLSDNKKRERIDDVNQYLWDNIWSEIENKKEISEEVIKYSEQLDYTEGAAFSILHMAVYYSIRKSPEDLPHFKIALKLYQSINDSKGILRCLNGLGVAYKQAKLYNKALEYYSEVAFLAKKENDQNMLSAAYDNISSVYIELGNFTQAKTILLKSYEIDKTIEGDLTNSYLSLGKVCYKMNEFENSIDYLKKALEYCHKSNQDSLLPEILNYTGKCHQELGQMDKAQEFYHEALILSEKTLNKDRITQILISLGHLMYIKKDYPKSRDYLEKALKICRDLNLYLQFEEIYELLYKTEKADKNFASALSYSEGCNSIPLILKQPNPIYKFSLSAQ